MQGVEKLVFVSKILLDVRVIELKNENEALKLQIFWEKYNNFKLQKAMETANKYGPNCKCVNCSLHSRAGNLMQHEIEQEKVCTFKPWFEDKAADCGITIGGPMGGDCHHMSACGDAKYGSVGMADYHLINNQHGSYIWGMSRYGSKMWRYKSAEDPELQKLVKLFYAMWEGERNEFAGMMDDEED